MELCEEITSKAIYLGDDEGNKITFTPPDKDIDMMSQPILGWQYYMFDESKFLKYFAEHPEID